MPKAKGSDFASGGSGPQCVRPWSNCVEVEAVMSKYISANWKRGGRVGDARAARGPTEAREIEGRWGTRPETWRLLPGFLRTNGVSAYHFDCHFHVLLCVISYRGERATSETAEGAQKKAKVHTLTHRRG